MPPHLHILRHGRSEANERGLIASTLENAGEAFGLTPEGRTQVRASIEQARPHVSEPISILSSPLLRARETADIAAELLGATEARSGLPGADVLVDSRLIERGFGDLELQPDARYEAVWEVDRRDPTHRTWNVESVADVWSRLRSLTDELRDEGAAGTIILVTHGDVASTLICGSSGAPLTRHREIGGLGTGEIRAVDWPPAEEPPIFVGDS